MRSLDFVTLVSLALVLVGCQSGQVHPKIRLVSDRTPTKTPQSPTPADRGFVEPLEQPNRFKASCRDFTRVGVRQREPVWCWAACAEMVHKYHDPESPLTQERIAELILNAGEEAETEEERQKLVQAAGKYQIMVALNPDLTPGSGKVLGETMNEAGRQLESGQGLDIEFNYTNMLESQFMRRSVNSDHLVRELAEGQPLVAGLAWEDRDATIGHAYVVYGVVYAHEDESGTIAGNIFENIGDTVLGDRGSSLLKTAFDAPTEFAIVEVELFDPWTGKSEVMDAETFERRVEFMMSRRVAREILFKERDFIDVNPG